MLRSTKVRVIAGAFAIASLPVLLGACGSSEPEMSPMREQFINMLRQDAASDGAPVEQVDCVVNGLSQFTDEQLQGIMDGSAGAEVTEATGKLYEECTGDS
ncbi:MAG: hypothetical protein ACKN9D_02795 [Actinomycetales bacterium]|jgi:hypothetical protein